MDSLMFKSNQHSPSSGITSLVSITSVLVELGLPSYTYPILLQANRAIIYHLHRILLFLYQEDVALAEVVAADDHAHPAILATNNVVRGTGTYTAPRMQEERKGVQDLALLIEALSYSSRDFNYKEAWNASYPSEMGQISPRNVLVYLSATYLNMVVGVWNTPHHPSVPYHSLLTIIHRDAPRLYYGLKKHPHLKQMLDDAGVDSSLSFRELLSRRSSLWNDAVNQAVAIWGPIGNDTKQARPLFTTDLMRLAMVMGWSVYGHRDYSACVMFAKKGPRSLVLLFATNWKVYNEPGTDNWCVTVYDVKIYSHRPLKEVTFWYRGYDGYRFGIFYRRRNSIEINSTRGRTTLFGYGSTMYFHKQMQEHLLNAGYPANFASCHSWRVGRFNETIIVSRSGKHASLIFILFYNFYRLCCF